jgi:hypothetical protein
MISNPATNFGFMLRLQTESATRALIFGSSDADPVDWPTLTITHSIATPLTATINTFSGVDDTVIFCSSCQFCATQFFVNRGPGFTYQWRLNEVNIPTATDTQYIVFNTDTGNYDCVISLAGCGSAVSNTIYVGKVDPPIINVTPESPPLDLFIFVTLTA